MEEFEITSLIAIKDNIPMVKITDHMYTFVRGEYIYSFLRMGKRIYNKKEKRLVEKQEYTDWDGSIMQ